MKRLIFVLPAAVMIGLLVLLLGSLERDPKAVPSARIDQTLPAFDLDPVVAGEMGLRAADFPGSPHILNVFASWCIPCRLEHPTLLALAQDGLDIRGLNWKEPAPQGAAWLAELGNPYRAAGSDPSGRAGIDLGVTGVPETFLIDAAGKIRYRHSGPVTAEVWQQKLAPVWQSIGGKPVAMTLQAAESADTPDADDQE